MFRIRGPYIYELLKSGAPDPVLITPTEVSIDSQNHWLEKTSKIIKSNCQPNTTMPAKPYPEVPHLHAF